MNQEQWNEGMNHIDSEIIENFINKKETIIRNKKTRNLRQRIWYMAACFAIIITAIVATLFNRDQAYIEPYLPQGDPWSPVIDSSVENSVLNVDEIADIFDLKYDGTNQYIQVYVASPEYLYLLPLPEAEYLPIFSRKKETVTKSNVKEFIDKYSNSVAHFFNIEVSDYEIEKKDYSYGTAFYEAKLTNEDESRRIYFIGGGNSLYFNYHQYPEQRLSIENKMVSVLESDTDEQIQEKLKDTIDYICNSFGKAYTEVKIERDYSYDQLDAITIYLYTPEETIFPENFLNVPKTSSYIRLILHTDWGKGTMCDWGGSKDEAFLTDVSLRETVVDLNEYYTVTSKSKKLSLEEAEKLLEKGYVFGGHSCPLCMAAQPEVDFSDYTCVDIEYVSGVSGEMIIPFYAFYKCINVSEDGIQTYAKTYVPAIEVSGLDEYFENQKSKHKTNSYYGVA